MNYLTRLLAVSLLASVSGVAAAAEPQPVPAAPVANEKPAAAAVAPDVAASAAVNAPAAPASAAEIDTRPLTLIDVLREAASKLAAPKVEKVAAPTATWVIDKDERIDLALKRWAAEAGWALSWLPNVSWECPSRVEFKASFTAAVIQVVEALNQDGKRLRLRIFDYEGGRSMEVVTDAQS